MHLAQTRRPLRLAAAVVAALIGLALVASPAHADPTPTGSLSWGFKASFRNYLTGLGGTVSAVAPATGTGVVSFPLASLSEDGLTTTGGIKFFYAAHGIDITLSNLKIESTSDTTAKLLVDLTTAAGTTSGAHLADLTITGETASSMTFSAVMAEGGVAAFGNYPKGTALDPITVTVDVPEATPTPSTPESSSPSASASAPGGELPTTGGDLTLYIGVGVLLVAAGAGALLIAQRRRENAV